MSEQAMLDVVMQGMWVAARTAVPLLAIGGGAGLFLAIIQAATQLSEPSLTFVPKILALGIALAWLGPFVVDALVAYNTELYSMIADVRQ